MTKSVSDKRDSRFLGSVLDPILSRTTRISPQTIGDRLDLLERVLPFAIVLFVLLYNIVFGFLLDDTVPPLVRFVVDNLIFGIFGAFVTLLVLEWLRHHFDLEAQREREFNAHAHQLAAITSDSADAILFIDTAGVIRSWNRGAELIFGYHANEIVGKHFQILLPQHLREQGELAYLEKELEGKGFIRGHITQRVTKNSETIMVELTRTLLRDETGAALGSSAILRDVTERERIQEQTRELNRVLEAQVSKRTRELSLANQELVNGKRELEKANAELRQLDELKSEFVSMVSHELRAPLANISGVFQLLLEDDHDSLSVNQRELLSLADEQVGRLARLVKGVLNVSRIQSGEIEFQQQSFDLLELFEKGCAHWSASDPRHRYLCMVETDLPLVSGDRDRVEEVIANLMDNAAKYSGEGTSIRLAAKVSGDEMVIQVQDEGVGISSEDLDKVFDKFYRVERDDARQTYGHGLGLYISRKFIEGMGGRLWVESQPGQGSIFYFTIPLAQKEAVVDTVLNR